MFGTYKQFVSRLCNDFFNSNVSRSFLNGTQGKRTTRCTCALNHWCLFVIQKTCIKANSHQTPNPTNSHRRPPIKESAGICGNRREKIVWCENPPTITDFFLKKRLIFHRLRPTICKRLISNLIDIVGSVKVNFLSYRYRADKSTIFGMRGLRGLTINS